jgi:outer membrane protein TolC
VTTRDSDQLPLPPLDTLYHWAELFSPSLKQQDALIDKATADTKRVKKSWMDAIRVGANFRTGNYGNTVINQTETGYSYGPTVSFSLYDLASSRNLVQVYKAEQKVALFKREEVIFELRKIITVLYNNVQVQKNILRIKYEAMNAALVHLTMAEKEFSQGAIAIGELSRVAEIHSKTQTEAEITLNDLKNYYMQLEQFCGKSFSSN